MKKVYFLSLVVLLMNGCVSSSIFSPKANFEEETLSLNKVNIPHEQHAHNATFLGFKPIEPMYIPFVEDSVKNSKIFFDTLDNKELLKLLPLQSAVMTLENTTSNNKLSYLMATVTGDVGNYILVMDYMKYRTEPMYDDTDGEFLGNGKVGVGLRIKAKIKTYKANLNLGSLLALGVESKNGNIQGEISIDIIGIDSKDVTNLVPLTSQIDESSIQMALQSLATIKSKLYEPDIKLTPHLIAINPIRIEQEEKFIKDFRVKRFHR